MAVIQYKMWDGHSFHQDPRLLKQTARLKKFACVNRLCDPDWDDRRTYRLPNCAAFLRPTDRLQNPDSLDDFEWIAHTFVRGGGILGD